MLLTFSKSLSPSRSCPGNGSGQLMCSGNNDSSRSNGFNLSFPGILVSGTSKLSSRISPSGFDFDNVFNFSSIADQGFLRPVNWGGVDEVLDARCWCETSLVT